MAHWEVWIVEEPTERQCVMVVMGRHRGFLPMPDDARSLETLSQSLVGDHDLSQPANFAFRGIMYPWPDRPLYLLDTPAEA